MNFSQDKRIDASVRFRELEGVDASKRSVEIQSFRYRDESHDIRSIRKVFQDMVGGHAFIHFLVETDQDAVFNVVFDTEVLAWYVISEKEVLLSE